MIDITYYEYWCFIRQFHEQFAPEKRRSSEALGYLFGRVSALCPTTQHLIFNYIKKQGVTNAVQ